MNVGRRERRASDRPRCQMCGQVLQPVHGHGACLHSTCPMFGLNQDACCNGEVGCPADLVGTAPMADPQGR